MKQKDFAPTERTRLKRLPKRGNFQPEAIYQILDEAFVCHVGFSIDGQPFVVPSAFARVRLKFLCLNIFSNCRVFATKIINAISMKPSSLPAR
ncbi:MAG: hypothetical protein M3388_09775 [Acidobacteriota bacterium]|nr:hypothetical protein [Acidobacteriota bacterium]